MDDLNVFQLRGVIAEVKPFGDKGFVVLTIESKGSTWDKDLRKFVDCTNRFAATYGEGNGLEAGMRVLCGGKIEDKPYTDKQGNKRNSMQLKIEMIKVFQQKQSQAPKGNEPDKFSDDGVPF